MLKWGVIGVGRAGQARARALHQDPRAQPLYGFRGQPEAVGLRRVEDLGDMLRRVDAVAVCTPDATHPDMVRACLSAGKHVLVEFPLAGSAEVGRELFDLARRHGRVLHVEHIELLGGAALTLRSRARGLPVRGGQVAFTGGTRKGTYGVAHCNVARLHRLLDAVGLPDGVQLQDRSPRHLRARLAYGAARVDLDFRHGADLPRRTTLRLELAREDGSLTLLEQVDEAVWQDGQPVDPPALPGLFLQDQLAATARILDGAPPYVGDERVLQVLSLADALVRASPDGSVAAWSGQAPGERAEEDPE
ncbi:Gfo/Idh/MocA family oxidoreductase [Myxococcota bacterium]|nr:Gfo/Idh/MocA family oxidoreductase [Myxococcota bacterium]